MKEDIAIRNRHRSLFPAPEGLDELLCISASCDGHRRERAVRLLGALGNPSALPAILERLNDWVPQVREAAKDALRRLATPAHAGAYALCLPGLYRLRRRWRDDHCESISFVERYLCAPANAAEVISAVSSTDPAVSRHCATLCLEHGLMQPVALVAMGLRHADVSVRLKAASLVHGLLPSERDEAYALALRNPFAPVRRMAVIALVEAGISEAVAREYLFDRHPSIRRVVASQFQHWSQPPLTTYRQRLASRALKASRIAAWGIGEYGKAMDAECLTPLLDHPSIPLRKQATVSYAKLLGMAAKPVVLQALSDPAPQVAAEAARLCIRLRLRPEAAELIDILRADMSPRRLTICLSAIHKSSKWERLLFILQALGMGGERERLLLALSLWERQFNLSYAQPSDAQLRSVASQLAGMANLLDPEISKRLSFTLEPFGIAPP